MTRHFCDACGKEADVLTAFAYLNHIGAGNPARCYSLKLGDTFHPWNGRKDSAQVCVPCYNAIMGEAYECFRNIQYGCGVTRCHECGVQGGEHQAGCSR